MNDLSNTWKNKPVFEKQLELNLQELNNYPLHWIVFHVVASIFRPDSILDIGCGCGTYYKICEGINPNIQYKGIDYSEAAITLAKDTWAEDNFEVKDYKDITSEYINDFDLVHMGALLDVLPNGDEALEFIMNLKPSLVLISRMKVTADDPSFYEVNTAYDKIETYSYIHNIETFTELAKKYNYAIHQIFEDNFLLMDGLS